MHISIFPTNIGDVSGSLYAEEALESSYTEGNLQSPYTEEAL